MHRTGKNDDGSWVERSSSVIDIDMKLLRLGKEKNTTFTVPFATLNMATGEGFFPNSA